MQQPPIDLWGISAPLQPLPGGHRNSAFRTLGLPTDFVFKSSRRSPDAILWLTKVHDLAGESGFIVPELVRSRTGQFLEDGWTCETFIAGETFSAEDMPAILPKISRFHTLASEIPQRPGFLSSEALITSDAGGDVDLLTMPTNLVETCRDAWRRLAGLPFTIVHGDLSPGNLLHCPNGQIALIDWDECRRDAALFDTGQLMPVSAWERRALLAWEAACSWLIEPDHARQVADQLRRMTG